MDRRAVFFLGAAVLSLAMVWPTPDKYRFVAWGLAGTYVLLALAAWLDGRPPKR